MDQWRALAEFLFARISEDEEGFMVGNYIPPMRHRLLLDCEVKRRIVHRTSHHVLWYPHPIPLALQVLKDLAAIYSDHPDWREEWAA